MPEDAARILVVDDEARVRHLISTILVRQGCQVAEAPNGYAALERLADATFDLIITDLHMPEMDGLTLLEQARALYPETDVLVLTAFGTVQSAVRAMKQGALDFIGKPFQVDDLRAKVQQCFERRRERAQARERSPYRPLLDLTRILSGDLGLYEMLDASLDLVWQTFTPACIEVLLFDQPGDVPQVLAHKGANLTEIGFVAPTRSQVAQLAQQDEAWLLCDQLPFDLDARRMQSGRGVLLPLRSGTAVEGAILAIRADGAPRYTRADGELLHVLGAQIGVTLLHSRTRQRLMDTFRDLERANLSAVETLFTALGTYDPNTHDHSERVARYAYQLGQTLGLAEGDLEQLRIAGLLHDIGKLGVGDATLRKNGQLDDHEFDRVKAHPRMGAKILAGVEALAEIVPLVLYHHEYYNGQGYPDGLAGEDIPLGARIIAVVDVFDSMTTDRPYRPALPVDEVLNYMLTIAGSKLDARLVNQWVALAEASQCFTRATGAC